MRRDLSIDDFFTGLLAALVERGVHTVSVRGEPFYRAMEASYQRLEALAAEHEVDPRFAVYLDCIYVDSPVIQEAIYGAVLRDLVSLSSPDQDLHIKLQDDQADALLARLPGGVDLYEDVARVFLRSYPFVAA